jgi:[ribosomal protein S5]-alanine N-acetyltransferase
MEQVEDIRLESRRLVLRTLDPSFAQRLLDYHLRNEDHFRRAGPALAGEFFTRAFQTRRLELEMEMTREEKMIRLFLFHRDDERYERIVGDLGFSNIIRGALQSCFLGYKIDRGETRQGLVTEALQCALPWIFRHMDLHRIEANIMPRNKASIRVVEKIGFRREGFSPKYLKINGNWEDHYRYAILKEELGARS